VRLIQDLDKRASGVDALDQGNAVHHAARGAVPFGNHQYIAGPKLVDRPSPVEAVP
jgi:hypothetical protein